MKPQTVKSVILVVLILITIIFIFSNSMESVSESSDRSEGVTLLIEPFLEVLLGDGNVTNHFVRKLAHFTEFFILGTELCILAVIWRKSLILPLFIGLLTALTDETIQVFFERGSQVQDIWLDFSAVVVTAVIAYLIKTVRRKRTVNEALN